MCRDMTWNVRLFLLLFVLSLFLFLSKRFVFQSLNMMFYFEKRMHACVAVLIDFRLALLQAADTFPSSTTNVEISTGLKQVTRPLTADWRVETSFCRLVLWFWSRSEFISGFSSKPKQTNFRMKWKIVLGFVGVVSIFLLLTFMGSKKTSQVIQY